MWKIDEEGNAKNEHGEEIRVKFSVETYRRKSVIPGFVNGFDVEEEGEFISLEAAKNYIRKLADKLNEEEIKNG